MTRSKRSPRQRAKPSARRRLFDLSTCYSGCMLGITLNATVFSEYARKYTTHRERMAACLEELGAKVTLPLRHKDFRARHQAIVSSVQSELARVSQPSLGWVLFGLTLIEFATKRAFRRADANVARRGLRLFLDKLQLPRTALSNLSRKAKVDKDGTLSLYKLHSAALAALHEIIKCMGRDTRTAFVAMPFSVPHMVRYYTDFYLPLLKTLELKPLRAWGGFGTEEYQDLLYTLIDCCGAMLADLTTLNPNVMHEVGYALGKGNKFIILLAEEGHAVPANLGDLAVLTYRPKGRAWQVPAAAELAATVALYQYIATTDTPGTRQRRIVGPMKVTE